MQGPQPSQAGQQQQQQQPQASTSNPGQQHTQPSHSQLGHARYPAQPQQQQHQHQHQRIASYDQHQGQGRDGQLQGMPGQDFYAYQAYASAGMQYNPNAPQQQPRQTSSNLTPIAGTPPTVPSPSPNPSPSLQQQQYYPSPIAGPSSAPAHVGSYGFPPGYGYQQQQQPYGHGQPMYQQQSQHETQAQEHMRAQHSPHTNHRGPPHGMYQQQPTEYGSSVQPPTSASTPTMPTTPTMPPYVAPPWTSAAPHPHAHPDPHQTASPAWQPTPSPRMQMAAPPQQRWYPHPHQQQQQQQMSPYPGGWQGAPGAGWSSTQPYPYNVQPHPLANPIQLSAPPHAQDYHNLGKQSSPSGSLHPHPHHHMNRVVSAEDDRGLDKHGKKKKGSMTELEVSPVAKVATQSNLHPPRQASSAWQLFFTDTLNAAKEAAKAQLGGSPGSSKDHPKLNVAHIAREAGVAYANMSPEQKAYYQQKVQESKDEYARKLAAWQATLTPDDIRAENAFRAQQRKEGKSRKGNLKDPNAPKKPLSAYFLYLRSIRENAELRKEVWGDEVGTTKQSVLAAQRWRNLTDDEKHPYLAQADKDKNEYETLRRAYEDEAAARARGEYIPPKSPMPPTPTIAAPVPPHKRKRDPLDDGVGPETPHTFSSPAIAGQYQDSPLVSNSSGDFPTPPVGFQSDTNAAVSFTAPMKMDAGVEFAPVDMDQVFNNDFPDPLGNVELGIGDPFNQSTVLMADDGGPPWQTISSLSSATPPNQQPQMQSTLGDNNGTPFSTFPGMQASMDFSAVSAFGPDGAFAMATASTTTFAQTVQQPPEATVVEMTVEDGESAGTGEGVAAEGAASHDPEPIVEEASERDESEGASEPNPEPEVEEAAATVTEIVDDVTPVSDNAEHLEPTAVIEEQPTVSATPEAEPAETGPEVEVVEPAQSETDADAPLRPASEEQSAAAADGPIEPQGSLGPPSNQPSAAAEPESEGLQSTVIAEAAQDTVPADDAIAIDLAVSSDQQPTSVEADAASPSEGLSAPHAEAEPASEVAVSDEPISASDSAVEGAEDQGESS